MYVCVFVLSVCAGRGREAEFSECVSACLSREGEGRRRKRGKGGEQPRRESEECECERASSMSVSSLPLCEAYVLFMR